MSGESEARSNSQKSYIYYYYFFKGIYRAFLEEIAGNSSSSEQNKEDFSQREQKNADSVEETQTDGSAGDNGSSADRKMKEILASKEKSSVNVSTSKSDADEIMETTNASGKTDGDAKKGTPTPPKTLGEVFEKHRLVFHDVNAVSFLIESSYVRLPWGALGVPFLSVC